MPQQLLFEGALYSMEDPVALCKQLRVSRIELMRSCIHNIDAPVLFGIRNVAVVGGPMGKGEAVLLVGEYGIFDKTLADLEAKRYRGKPTR